MQDPRRITLAIVAVHVALSLSPLADRLMILLGIDLAPYRTFLTHIIIAPPLAQMMLLAAYLGFSNANVIKRVVLAPAGVAYLVGIFALVVLLGSRTIYLSNDDTPLLNTYVIILAVALPTITLVSLLLRLARPYIGYIESRPMIGPREGPPAKTSLRTTCARAIVSTVALVATAQLCRLLWPGALFAIVNAVFLLSAFGMLIVIGARCAFSLGLASVLTWSSILAVLVGLAFGYRTPIVTSVYAKYGGAVLTIVLTNVIYVLTLWRLRIRGYHIVCETHKKQA